MSGYSEDTMSLKGIAILDCFSPPFKPIIPAIAFTRRRVEPSYK
ncbi:MAG: hypothetical protein QW096_10155 [Thermofilaceae archaeon]